MDWIDAKIKAMIDAVRTELEVMGRTESVEIKAESRIGER